MFEDEVLEEAKCLLSKRETNVTYPFTIGMVLACAPETLVQRHEVMRLSP